MGVQTHFEISETNAWLYTPMDAVPRGMSILGYVPRCCRLNQILTVCRQTDFLAFYQEYLPFLFLFALFDCIGRPIVAINLAVLCRSHTVCYAALLPLSWQFCRTKFCWPLRFATRAGAGGGGSRSSRTCLCWFSLSWPVRRRNMLICSLRVSKW